MEVGRPDAEHALGPVRWSHRAQSLLDAASDVDWRRWSMALGVVVAALGAVFVLGVRSGRPEPLDLPMVDAATVAAQPPATVPLELVHVHVAGEVLQPGLYRAMAGSRVADLVDAAGGPTSSGDVDRLNLALVVRDGDRIEVPTVGEPFTAGESSSGSSDQPLDLNRATAAELETLPGVGPSLAAAIVEHRERFGAFGSLDELEEVSGIGPATVERLRALARV